MNNISKLIIGTFLFSLQLSTLRAEEVTLKYNDLTLNANLEIAEGKKLSDGVVLITHGTQAHDKLEMISYLQELLSDNGRSTLAINLSLGVDNRHGLYDCAVPSTYRHEDAIAEIGVWVNWLKMQGVQDLVLLGHSRGGNQSAWYAAEHDQPMIKSVVLMAPGVSTPAGDAESYQRRFGKSLEPLLAKAQALVDADKGGTLMEHVPFLFICQDHAVTAESFVSHYRDNPQRDSLYWLPKLVKPTLVVVAGADEVVPTLGERVQQLADGKRLQVKVIDGSGHFFRDLNADEAVENVLAFIGS